VGKYSFILEFSGLDRSMPYSPADARIAERQAVDYLNHIGLGNPDAYGGKGVLAKVGTSKGGKIKGITLECDNEVDIEKIVSALSVRGIDLKHTLGEISLTSQFNNQEIAFKILYKFYPKDDGIPTLLAEGPGGIETMKVAYERLEEAVYQIIGDGESSIHEKGIAHSPERQSLLKSLERTIAEVATGNGRKPIVFYTDDGDFRQAKIMPPMGTTISRLSLTGDFVPDNNRQKRGVIYYTHAGIEIQVHRRNIGEKYDIKGRLDRDSQGSSAPVSDPQEYSEISGILSSLPIEIHAGDGEINVGYKKQGGRTALLISPKRGESLTVVGFDDAVAEGKILKKTANKKDVRFFEVVGKCIEVMIFAQASSERAEWDEKFKDDFDKFYDSWLLAHGTVGQ
jgi:hypothetical protein